MLVQQKPIFDAEFDQTPMDDDEDYNKNDDLMFSLIRKNKSSNQLEIDDGRQLFGQYDLFNDFLNKPQSHHQYNHDDDSDEYDSGMLFGYRKKLIDDERNNFITTPG